MAKIKLSSLAVVMSLAMTPNVGSASVIGFLGNFDVINDTGSTAYGFEIELEGLHASDITDTFGGLNRGFPSGRGFDPATSVVRYGAPTVTEYTSGAIFGTKVIYQGVFNGTSWDYSTPSGTFITPGDNCWSGGGIGYSASTPCDHFGVGTSANATKTTYSWLHEVSPGVLSNANGVVSLPAPVWNVSPPNPADPAALPQVVAQIQAPRPEVEDQFGEAIWVKVFTTELEDQAILEDLVGGNKIYDNAKTEVEWQLLQYDPGNPASGQIEKGYAMPVGNASFIRRYEFYKYAGAYNDEDHQALVGSDSNPLESEIGTYIGAQNAAANILAANVAAVPEPETYAMLLVGVGLIGLRLRSHKKAMCIG